jgi:RNA polymerase sigma factor (sigma-70 family)
MTRTKASPILHLIRRMAEDQHLKELPDQELLGRFSAGRDEAAFAALMRRHGAMVLDICRNMVRNEADAEDAFQATFLVLARRAGAIRRKSSVGSWLHGVAYRIALKAQADFARRQKRAARDAAPTPAAPADDLTWREVQQALHAELDRLSESYRAPLVLCYLEGNTQDEAALLLGVSRATVKKRLESARALLRQRLARRGLGPAAVLALAAWPAASVSAAVPSLLFDAALKAVTTGAAALVVSARVAALTREVMRTMFLSKLFDTTAGLLIAGFLVVAVLIPGLYVLPPPSLAQQPAAQQQEKPQDAPARQAGEAGQDSVKVPKPGKWVNSLAYCNDGKSVALVLWNGAPRADTQAGSVVVWDLEKGKVEHTLAEFDKFDDDTLQYWRVVASKNGKAIAASATAGKVDYGAIRVWEAKTGKVLQTFEFSAQVQGAVALSADGKTAAGGDMISAGGEVCVWNVASGKLLQRLATPNMDNASLALSENGKWIAAGGWAGPDGLNRKNKLMVWDLQTGKLKYEWTDPNMVGSVGALAFSPDAGLLAAGGFDDGTVRLWDLQTGKLKHQLNGHTIQTLAFSPDGKTLASAGMDGKIILWDVVKEKARDTLSGHGKDDQGRGPMVLGAVFSPDGRTLASGGGDGTMRFWRLAPAAAPKK